MPQPKLFIDLERFYSECYTQIKNFPKLDKHLLGKDVLFYINETHKYALMSIHNCSYLVFCSANFDLAKKSLRITMEKKIVSYGWYSSQLDLINSIGKEIGSWMKRKSPSFKAERQR